MLNDTPLRKRHLAFVEAAVRRTASEEASRPGAAQGHAVAPPELEYLAYGPGGTDGDSCEIVSTYGMLESEYAALRRATGVLDSPHRATLRITGGDRLEFLGRMVTQELAGLEAGGTRETFWLNRKGRIEADMLLVELGDVMFADLDVHQAEAAVRTLNEFVFAEEIELRDVTAEMHRIALHGHGALETLGRLAGSEQGGPSSGEARRFECAGTTVVAARHDVTGEPGIELFVPRPAAEAVWDALLADVDLLDGARPRTRPIGWQAFNIARIEAGTPLMNVDFDSSSLPHETGLLDQRVSFTKGCYLGQEVVARMQSLGRPKQTLVGLRIDGEHLPVAGGQVLPAEEDGPGTPVGVVTSSTLSPMLGAAPIAFAMVRIAHAEPGTSVRVAAEGELVKATVGALRFWPRPDEAPS